MNPGGWLHTRWAARRLIVMLAAMVVAVITALLGASPARAHASLDSSSPAAFAVLEQSPTEVRLRFTEAPQDGLSTLRLIDADNRELSLGALTRAPDDDRTLTASVEPLSDGVYVVVWSVVSGDGHRVAGSFAFSVGVGSVEAARDLLARVAAGASGDTALDAVVWGVRALGFVGLALLLGGAWLRHGTGAGRHAPRPLDHMIWVGWAWALMAAALMLPLQAAQVTGGRLADVVDVHRWGSLLEVRQGQALVARMALLALAAWLVVRGPHGSQRRSWHPAAALVGLGLAATHTLAGHAATASWPWLAVGAGAVHLAAVTGWLGVVGGLAVGARQWDGGPGAALAAAAPLARSAVPLAVVTGGVSTVLVGPPLDELLQTSWGRWLALKVALVGVLLVVGVMLGRGALERSVPWRPRLLLAEVIVGVATFAAAAALVSTPPTAAVTIEPVTTTLVQAGVLAEVTITPARVGANELHLVMSPPGGSLQPVGRVTATLTALDRDVPPFAVDLAVAGVNHWTSPVQFPYGGRWQLAFVAEVRPLEFVQYRTEFAVTE